MVRSRENIKENTLCLLTNIGGFLLLDMGIHNIDYNTKQRFRIQLYYVIFILDQQTLDGDENDQQHLWDRGMDLINSENTMETMMNSFTRHGAMYARVLYNFYQNNQGAIAHIDRFLNCHKRNLSSETDVSGAYSPSNYSSSSDSSRSNSTDS